MTINPAVSANVTTYASREPYLTSAEYIASPTGVDISELVVGGNDAQQADALKQTIARASSAIDTYCRKVLAATLDTQSGRYRLRSDGNLIITLDNTPIIEVTNVAIGATPNQLTPLQDLSGVWINRKTIEVPVAAITQPGPWLGGKLYVVASYINGWANCLLTADAAQGATAITVDSALGVQAGLPMTVYDPGASEQVVVLSVVGNTINLASPLTAAHLAGVAVSALPPVIKQACVLWTTGLIKTKGDDSFVMPAIGAQPSQITPEYAEGIRDLNTAAGLLQSFRRAA